MEIRIKRVNHERIKELEAMLDEAALIIGALVVRNADLEAREDYRVAQGEPRRVRRCTVAVNGHRCRFPVGHEGPCMATVS